MRTVFIQHLVFDQYLLYCGTVQTIQEVYESNIFLYICMHVTILYTVRRYIYMPDFVHLDLQFSLVTSTNLIPQ